MKENSSQTPAKTTAIVLVGRKVWTSADTSISIWNRKVQTLRTKSFKLQN
jgi:hypothetical protein